MKEPITERDLIVISTLCACLGALLSWGLFYRWGSAPGLKPLDTSAWVQALVAATVGTAAVYVPKQIAKNENRRRVEIFVTLLANVLQSASTLARLMVEDRPNLVMIDGLLRDIELQGKALESYPVGEIPSASLLLHSVETKSHYPGLTDLAKRMLPEIEAHGSLYPNQVSAIKVYGNAIEQLLLDVASERP